MTRFHHVSPSYHTQQTIHADDKLPKSNVSRFSQLDKSEWTASPVRERLAERILLTGDTNRAALAGRVVKWS